MLRSSFQEQVDARYRFFLTHRLISGIVYSGMTTIQKRKSRGKTYWYIVESRRVNGKPRPVVLAYLGKAEDLLARLAGQREFEVKSYSHGDTAALLHIAQELDVVSIINRHVGARGHGKPIKRNDLSTGASLLLAAIGRACRPTSKRGWYQWCETTSLEYCLKRTFKKLDSQHFWDQMNAVPVDAIAQIEKDLVEKLIDTYEIKLDCLFFDTTNFFTYIDSTNSHCNLPQRGKNKQKRYDLRQVGLALLVSRKEQLPLFHQTYRGNKNDYTVFKEVFSDLTQRLRSLSTEMEDVTLVFDKGNNSKSNFKKLDNQRDLYYVAGLVPSYFSHLIEEANQQFETAEIDGKQIPVYRCLKEVWGMQRTCLVTISQQLLEGQVRGIHQHLKTKCKLLDEFKQKLERPKRRLKLTKDALEQRLKKTIKGQFIDLIVRVDFIELQGGHFSFTYWIDSDAFEHLKQNLLGRKILVTNRHEWSNEAILLAYRGQAKVEYAFRNLKNPFHLAVRPQYHWTDQKIAVHHLICVIGYLLAVTAYTKVRRQGAYTNNLDHFMTDMKSIRLASFIEIRDPRKRGGLKTSYRLEQIPPKLENAARILHINDNTLRPKIDLGVYN